MSNIDSALPEGSRIADYTVVSVLGEPGSFGITYRATDVHLNRDVAIKEYFPNDYAVRQGDGSVAPRDESRRATFEWGLERFSEEARTLAQFDHRNIVKVLRLIADVNGTAYIVMELVRGRTLESMVEANGPMDAAAFTPIFSQLLDGCAAIHGIGILHRDIKPSNIIVTEAGAPVLIDFGAARDLALQKKSGFTAIVTDTYSPPEQYSREQPQGPWTDIYALAATAYYALCGGPLPPSTARAVGDATTPAVQAGAGRAGVRLLKGLDWALSLKAQDRPQSVEQWRKSLDLEPPAPAAAPAGRQLDRRALVAIAGGALALGGIGALMALTNGGGKGGRPLAEGQAPLRLAWTQDVGAVDGDPWPALAISPRGVLLASRRLGPDGQARMLALQLDAAGHPLGEWLADEPGSAAQAVFATPDGGAFVGGDQGGMARVVRLGPDMRPLWSRTYGECEVRSFLALKDGVIAAVGSGFETGRARLAFLSGEGSQTQDVSLLDKTNDSVERVSLLADGGLVVLGSRVTNQAGRNTTQLWVARLDRSYRELWRTQEYGAGSARGWALAVTGRNIFVAGTSSTGAPGDPSHLLLMRLETEEGRKLWSRTEDKIANGSGRALALVGEGGKPRLYLAGTAGSPAIRARVGQLANDGRLLWSQDATPRSGARAEGAVALAFKGPGDGYSAGFSFDGSQTRLLVSRLTT